MPLINKKIYRLIDANLNRLKEGLRVLEDILRFILEDEKITRQIKNLRHEITSCIKKSSFINLTSVLDERDTKNDVGKKSTSSELKRKSISEIALANAQRVKESVRVLEEFFKLYDLAAASSFKKIRYKIYNIEKQVVEKISKMCNNRQRNLKD